MVPKPRAKLSTREAQRVGVAAAREWEARRQEEEVAYNAELAKQQRKEDFMQPLIEAGVSRRDAETAYAQHVLESAKERGEHARSVYRRSRMQEV